MWSQTFSLDAALLRFPLPSELWHVSTGGADTTVSLDIVGTTNYCTGHSCDCVGSYRLLSFSELSGILTKFERYS